ncbi:MAG: hypothetical protein KatS3mg017_0473 [Fimbriimonadales bacterium]|nr:MAG: hypothetical protein KatS3mg017_0473 [Fimbriimonadales bacterium]
MNSQEHSVCSYRAFIDESGDEGFAFERSSSLWFVISAVIVPDTNEVEAHLVSILDETHMTINKVHSCGSRVVGSHCHSQLPPVRATYGDSQRRSAPIL